MKINKPCKGHIYAKAESLPWKWWNLRKRHHLVAVTENQIESFVKTALLERKSFYLSCRWQSLLGAEGPQKTCLSLDQNHTSKSLPRRLPVRQDVVFSSCSSRAPDHGLTSCGTCAWWPRDTWDLPRLGTKPLSPALPGTFLTTGPPGKPQTFLTTKFYSVQQFFST